MYYLRQLYRNDGQHYRRISHYLGIARLEMNYISNAGEEMWKKMEKVMKFVNLQFWEQLFKTLRKVLFKDKSNILEYHILDPSIKGKQHAAENIKKLVSHKKTVTIQ